LIDEFKVGNKDQIDSVKISREVHAKLKLLCKRDNYHWAIAVLKDYLLIAGAIYLTLGVSLWFYPISVFIIGSTQRALSNILHEATHKILAKNDKLNIFVGTVLSGYPIMHLFKSYSHSHIKNHHAYLGDEVKDPDYNFHISCGLYDTQQTEKEFFIKNILLTLSGYRTIRYVGYVLKDRVKAQPSTKNTISEKVPFTIFWFAVIGVIAYTGVMLEFLMFWIIPLFTAAVTIGWIIELAEHYPLPESEVDALLLTRNRKGLFLENFFFGRHYDNYHLIHHLHPAVPHWNMVRAHKILLEDANYARWDRLWGGIFTRESKNPNGETVLSYAAKYRSYKLSKEIYDCSFGKHMFNRMGQLA
jgi:fatty acid desaturase